MLKSTLRPIMAFGIIGLITVMWAYLELATTQSPDTLLTLVVFLAAIASLIYMFGKGTVSSALGVLEKLQGGDSDE